MEQSRRRQGAGWEASCNVLGDLGDDQGASWACLGAAGGRLGADWALFGGSWRRCGPLGKSSKNRWFYNVFGNPRVEENVLELSRNVL